MRAVHVGIGHDDDLVIAELFDVELLADARAERGDDGLELVVAVDLVGARLFHVQHLAPEGEDGLEARVASLRGGAACGIALDDVDLGERGVAVVAVAELVRHLAGFQPGLAADRLARLARGLAGAVCHHRLFENGLAHGRIFLKIFRKLRRDDGADERAHGGVAELGLRLALKLRVGQLDRHNGGQSLAHIVAGDLVVGLDVALFEAVGVEHARERALEALLVHAALGGMDVVCERDDGLGVAVVVLQRDLGRCIVLLAGHVDDAVLNGRLVTVIPAHEFPDAALVAHGVVALLFGLFRGLGALVLNGDVQSGVQKRLLAHTGMQRFVVVLQRVEHLAVGLEGDLRAVPVRGADDAHLLRDVAAGEFHLIDLAVLADLDLEPLGQGVDDRRADAVQTAGDLIAPAAELAARVQNGIDDLERGLSRLLLDVNGDAAAVVRHGDGVAGVDGHADVLAVACQRLVHRVVHDLVDEVVQTRRARRADVHAGALAHGLQTLKDLNLTGVVLVLYGVVSDFFAHIEAPLPEKR